MANDVIGPRRYKLVVVADSKSKGELATHLTVASQANEGAGNNQYGADKGRGGQATWGAGLCDGRVQNGEDTLC